MNMISNGRKIALALIAPALVSACATKGWVRKEIATQRTTTDSLIEQERVARVAGDSANAAAMQAMVASLRQDLDAMRSQFDARIAVVEQGLQFALPVTFAFDDATVGDDVRPALERFAQIAQKYYPGSAITVEGFADPAGSARYNIELSRQRALNVREALASYGLPTQQVRAVAMGETRLVVPGAERDDPGAQQNRRVVFVIESSGDSPAVALATPDE
jgi:peptidoglycan-associated lipoprotein